MDKSTIYQAEQRAWRICMDRQREAIAARYPDTGGNDNYFHNWYVCNKDKAIAAEAQAFRDTLAARWPRVKAWFNREYDRAHHREHEAEGRVGAYMWCERCQATLGKRIEHYSDTKGQRFYRVVPA